MRVEDERGVALAEANLAASLLVDGDREAAAVVAARSLERVRRLDLRVVLPYVMAVNAHTLLATDRKNRWSAFGKAGQKPDGDTWFCTGMEPWFAWGKNASPGELNFYAYGLYRLQSLTHLRGALPAP